MSRARRRLFGVSVFAALVFCAPGARAQAVAEDTAESHVRRGLALRRSGDDNAALAEFERAQVIAPAPHIRAQIGLALQALGRWIEAEQVDLQVLAEGSDPWVQDHSGLLHESLTMAQAHLGWLIVESNVAGAKLLVNGMPGGTLPLSHPVRAVAGAVVLQVSAEGYEPVLRTIDVPSGGRARESVVLVASMSPPNAAPSTFAGRGTVQRTVGWVTALTGGLLAAGGIYASIVSEVHSSVYNDDSRCFMWPLSRDQRCGVERGIAETARATAVVAFAAGGLAIAVGGFLIVTSPSRPRRSFGVACHPGGATLVFGAQY